MKINFTRADLRKNTATRVCKRPLNIVTESFLVKSDTVTFDQKTTPGYTTATPGAGCNTNSAITSTYHICNDAKQSDASFFLLPAHACHAEPCHTEHVEVSSLKISFMKLVLRCLQIVVNFFTNVLSPFFKGLFKSGIFNNEYKSPEPQLVPVNIQHTSSSPFNKLAMRNYSPTIFPKVIGVNKKLIMKTFLRKSGIFAVTLLIANLFLVNNAIGQFPVEAEPIPVLKIILSALILSICHRVYKAEIFC